MGLKCNHDVLMLVFQVALTPMSHQVYVICCNFMCDA